MAGDSCKVLWLNIRSTPKRPKLRQCNPARSLEHDVRSISKRLKTIIPTLQLKANPQQLLKNYNALLEKTIYSFENQFPRSILFISGSLARKNVCGKAWKQNTDDITRAQKTQNNWESAILSSLAKGFSWKSMAKHSTRYCNPSFSVLKKGWGKSFRIWSLAFGQAGFWNSHFLLVIIKNFRDPDRCSRLNGRFNEMVTSPKFFRLRPPTFSQPCDFHNWQCSGQSRPHLFRNHCR